MWVQSLGWEDPLEEGVATHSVFLPGESHGQRGLASYSPQVCKESDTIAVTQHAAHHLNDHSNLQGRGRHSSNSSYLWQHNKSQHLIATILLYPTLQKGQEFRAWLTILLFQRILTWVPWWCSARDCSGLRGSMQLNSQACHIDGEPLDPWAWQIPLLSPHGLRISPCGFSSLELQEFQSYQGTGLEQAESITRNGQSTHNPPQIQEEIKQIPPPHGEFKAI